jgi:hypothetical protein
MYVGTSKSVGRVTAPSVHMQGIIPPPLPQGFAAFLTLQVTVSPAYKQALLT